MKNLLWASVLLSTELMASSALAQTPPTDKAAARAERKAEGTEATREFMPGEGNPKPDARPKVSKAERAQARPARRAEGTAAAKAFKPGEENPKPEATARLSRAERSAGRKASRTQVAKQNKAGQLPSYGENYGGK